MAGQQADEGQAERPEYETLAALTGATQARVSRLKELAQESRDLWEQVGQDITDMRRLSPRHAVVRRQWMEEVGLDSFSRPAQIAGIVKWGSDRQEVEEALTISPFTTTPQAIMAAYWKGRTKALEAPSNKARDRYMFEQSLPENPYSAAEVTMTHDAELDRDLGKRMRDARRHGVDELAAAQYAHAYALAEAAKAHEAMVTAMRHREAEGLPDDPDADY